MENYVDDMIGKSSTAKNHIRYLLETFEILRRYKTKLTLKYAFGVSLG